MKRAFFLFSLMQLLALFIYGQDLSSGPSSWKYNTVAHRLLQVEELAFQQSGADYGGMYAVLDSVIDLAGDKISLIREEGLADREEALRIMEAIDRALWELDFIICIKTSFLSEALRRTRLPQDKSGIHFYEETEARPGDSSVYYGASLNRTAYPQVTLMSAEKKAEFLANPQRHYHLFDCDLGGYIYLGVGEALGLPIYLVEVPGHFFVRYEYGNGDYLNWDNNSAREYTNDDYRQGYCASSKKSFDQATEEECFYLRSLNRAEATALHTSFIVRDRLVRSNPDLALGILEYVGEINPASTYANPRLAEGYNTYGYTKTLLGQEKLAVSFFEKAIAYAPLHGRALDNLGFALIRTGDPEGGKAYLDSASFSGTNLPVYSLRNLGAYYFATGKIGKAKRTYKKAIRMEKKETVDLAEYLIAEVLLARGRERRAKKYLQISAERGEVRGKRRLEDLEIGTCWD